MLFCPLYNSGSVRRNLKTLLLDHRSSVGFSIVWQGGIGTTWWISRETPLPSLPPLDSSRREGAAPDAAQRVVSGRAPRIRVETPPSPPLKERVGQTLAAPKWLRPRRRGEEAPGSSETSAQVDAPAPRNRGRLKLLTRPYLLTINKALDRHEAPAGMG